MLIISQDRMTVVNLDAVARFGVSAIPVSASASRPDYEWAILADMSRPVNGAVLGRYTSKERAIDVLQEITTGYQKYIFGEGGPLARRELYAPPFAFDPPKVYTMPEE